jgi:hypothetical protein
MYQSIVHSFVSYRKDNDDNVQSLNRASVRVVLKLKKGTPRTDRQVWRLTRPGIWIPWMLWRSCRPPMWRETQEVGGISLRSECLSHAATNGAPGSLKRRLDVRKKLNHRRLVAVCSLGKHDF